MKTLEIKFDPKKYEIESDNIKSKKNKELYNLSDKEKIKEAEKSIIVYQKSIKIGTKLFVRVPSISDEIKYFEYFTFSESFIKDIFNSFDIYDWISFFTKIKNIDNFQEIYKEIIPYLKRSVEKSKSELKNFSLMYYCSERFYVDLLQLKNLLKQFGLNLKKLADHSLNKKNFDLFFFIIASAKIEEIRSLLQNTLFKGKDFYFKKRQSLMKENSQSMIENIRKRLTVSKEIKDFYLEQKKSLSI